MALTPGWFPSLRSLVWLMSHRNPHLSSFSSSAAAAAIQPAAPGTAIPAVRAVQPPAAPDSSCSRSVALEQKVLHPLPSSTPKIPIHKPSRRPTSEHPKNMIHPSREPQLVTNTPQMRSLESPTHLIPGGSCSALQSLTDKRLPAKRGDYKDPKSPRFSSSSHFPDQPTPEPIGESLTPTLQDPPHSVPGESCSTLQPVTCKPSLKGDPDHEAGGENSDVQVPRIPKISPIPKDSTFHDPPHPPADP
ncbi:hypothetical protein TRIUR3_15983 [Triticum urartu]|uniref:Uncharacterized protein n=1 Tax=Triticum urartu TaxID=4572 RepID=M7ZFE8_TRIUA|nr:extensin-like [Triticum urartu]XP_048542679.1 extensin-like [Triticum urartu]XP_048544245.1 extensin-like [Triticum urartu]XP_048544246.1 extensin-like [Triticum urartu]EMS58802.1 hypothetical protein TRIUR3_15983 [Triticum urartu]